ncbi:hypothetical protein LTR47_007911 [Exophiala xenobiotica]|nr:hypothetical protein LTR47_007911 [Exophiala xenobiotica]KAK5248003.1 hypothetical protein LTS06_006871 [Exophiala xenobiotica]KAK5352613.1 hypothetical protein LTR61_003739 [Exophiala xenobiotica]KAK5375476.1 hypothetical protein LTR11_005026 [Exophiala xenobiotica]KAK5391275.1 hypothetical protein LTS03_000648 [Exophiala xenobiotica]
MHDILMFSYLKQVTRIPRMSVSTSISLMTAEIETFHPVGKDAGVRSRAASPAKLTRMQSIPEEPVEESAEPVELEPEDDPHCGGSCALGSEVAPGQQQQSERVLEYVTKIREAIRLQGERLQEGPIETREQEEDENEAEVGLDSKDNTESKRESVPFVASARSKSALSGLKAKGARQRESIFLAASTEREDALAGLKTAGGRISRILSFRRSGGLLGQPSSQTVVRPVSLEISSQSVRAGEQFQPEENDSELETESLTDVEDGEQMALLPKGSGSCSGSTSSLSRSEREYKYQALQKSRFLRGVDTARGRVNQAKPAARDLLSVRRRPGGWSKLKGQGAGDC